jgi:hypothetical protein
MNSAKLNFRYTEFSEVGYIALARNAQATAKIAPWGIALLLRLVALCL